jgi:hypothetical protein
MAASQEATGVLDSIQVARERERWQVRQDLPRGKNRQVYDLKVGD